MLHMATDFCISSYEVDKLSLKLYKDILIWTSNVSYDMKDQIIKIIKAPSLSVSNLVFQQMSLASFRLPQCLHPGFLCYSLFPQLDSVGKHILVLVLKLQAVNYSFTFELIGSQNPSAVRIPVLYLQVCGLHAQNGFMEMYYYGKCCFTFLNGYKTTSF